ncbi:MAG: DUF6102 family protein [Oscillospiraceae bacterium]|nr:DUF6102 family protein [Oscillospiraceae bacterium]
MEVILIALISAILTVALEYVNDVLNSIVPIALHAEQYMTTLLGGSGFQATFDVLFNFGISLIVLKFLKRAFDSYVLWQDGDPDSDPLNLVTKFLRAIVVAVSFPTLYNWLADATEDMTNQILNSLSGSLSTSFANQVMSMASLNLFNAIVSLVFFICFFFLYIQFLMRGMEILVLRMGVPIACTGLLENDKGVFASYIKKFFQSTFTVVVQISLAKMSVGLMLNAHVFWGIAAMMLALKTPKFLQEFMLISSGGGNPMNTVYHTTRMVQMAKSVIKK